MAVIVHAIKEVVATEARASGPGVMTAVGVRHLAPNRLPFNADRLPRDAVNRRRLAVISWMISRLGFLRTTGLMPSHRSRNLE